MAEVRRSDSTFYFEGMKMRDETFKSLGMPMVGKSRTMESYIEQEYAHAVSQGGIRFRNQLRTAGQTYGGILHEIQGDGNCLATAFCASLLYALNGNPELIKRLEDLIKSLPRHVDHTKSMDVINALQDKNDAQRDHFLSDNETMAALSRMIRTLARQEMPKLHEDYVALVDTIVPIEPGKEIEITCIEALSDILGIRSHVIVLATVRDEYNLQKYPDTEEQPNLVIIRKAAHYLTIIPEALTGKIEKIVKKSLQPVDTAPIDKPVVIENSYHILFIALAIILALGILFYLFRDKIR